MSIYGGQGRRLPPESGGFWFWIGPVLALTGAVLSVVALVLKAIVGA